MSEPTDGTKSGGRDASGRFATGNPGGGRPALPAWFREGGPDALRHLLDIAKGTATDDKVSRAQACMSVIERVYGKPTQAVDLGDSMPAVAAALLEMAAKSREPKA